ncbi:hypothetical protein Q7O_003642 [Pectobacterium carotovorum subsp. carotovorum PCCS1]|nr:hypothetical protein [Pectobacterium carotovorum subsp. carotovorum PCCS1]
MAKLAQLILCMSPVIAVGTIPAGILVPDIENVVCFILMGTDEVTI